MEHVYQVQGFSDVVFTDEGCKAYGINPDDITDFNLWAAYPWQVFNIAPAMVYAFDWSEVSESVGIAAKTQGRPIIDTGMHRYLGTPRSIFQTIRQQEAA